MILTVYGAKSIRINKIEQPDKIEAIITQITRAKFTRVLHIDYSQKTGKIRNPNKSYTYILLSTTQKKKFFPI